MITDVAKENDINGDGELNSEDMVILKSVLLVDTEEFDADTIANCDVNIDGELNILDLIRLKKLIANA